MYSTWSNGFTLAIALGLALIIVLNGLQREYEKPGPLGEEAYIEVPQGASLNRIAAELESKGVISNAWLFSAAARKQGVAGSLKAGEYAIEPGASMRDVLERIAEGAAIQHRITVAEGLSSWEIVQIINDPRYDEVLEGKIEEIPAEGSLAPDTYFVQRGEDRAAVVERMKQAQLELLEELWAARAPDLPVKTKEEALILASIVEKETGVASERPQVASVFVNRLNDGMKLQSDPTIIYGITQGKGPLGRGLRRSEIKNPDNLYDTYAHNGLTPTPIANPGRASIAAVLNPATTDYYYFVADGTGGHAFAKTLAEHNRNVAQWRKVERQRQQNNN